MLEVATHYHAVLQGMQNRIKKVTEADREVSQKYAKETELTEVRYWKNSVTLWDLWLQVPVDYFARHTAVLPLCMQNLKQ